MSNKTYEGDADVWHPAFRHGAMYGVELARLLSIEKGKDEVFTVHNFSEAILCELQDIANKLDKGDE